MSDFIAKAQQVAREEGISFRAACSVLGKRSAAKRKARTRQEKEKEDWRRRRWDMDYENLN